MHVFGIKDLENLSGIKAHTIRIWEQRYSFLKPERTPTRVRYYSNKELKIILDAALLNRCGYKISEIDRMNEQAIHLKIKQLTAPELQGEIHINELIHCIIDLDIEGIEKILDDYISVQGLDKAIQHLIFPFLERTGILWMRNRLHPAQEGLVSNIMRQNLIAGIEGSSVNISSNKKILLFLPEGGSKDLGLLCVCYLLKKQGIEPIYLGANVPVKDIQFIWKCKKPHFLCTHLTNKFQETEVKKFIKQINQLMPFMPLIILGGTAGKQVKKMPVHIHFKQSLTEVVEFATGV
jgi:MerR family transcriptional regulator, light-induced transcriptional regulator